MNWNHVLEYAALGQIIDLLTGEGAHVKVEDHSDGSISVTVADDDGKQKHWVLCVFGNGPSFVSDFNLCTETLIQPALDFLAAFDN